MMTAAGTATTTVAGIRGERERGGAAEAAPPLVG